MMNIEDYLPPPPVEKKNCSKSSHYLKIKRKMVDITYYPPIEPSHSDTSKLEGRIIH